MTKIKLTEKQISEAAKNMQKLSWESRKKTLPKDFFQKMGQKGGKRGKGKKKPRLDKSDIPNPGE